MPPPAIIAATDFSPRSARVAERAALIARRLHARLVLTHIVAAAAAEPTAKPTGAPAMASESASADTLVAPPPGDTTEAARGTLSRLGRSLLGRSRPQKAPQAALQTLAQGLGPGIEIRLIEGEVDTALSSLADAENALMLVLGLHRRRRVLDALRLTTMERIVLAAPVPVLIADQRPRDGYRRVLAPTDFSPASAEALRWAARIAPGASFHAIHALQLPLGARFSPGEAASDAALTRAEQLRAAFLALPGMPAFAEPPEIVPGGVHEVLAFRQNELQADLLCIGTHSGRDPLQLGNYARDLMRAPPADLLIARPQPSTQAETPARTVAGGV
ncbi:MAG TPA: universal stress protein [Paracoccus sp.]|nr:universal stress protein [Paracoccus sp. (in: a-proteobacteria)]